MGIAAKHKFLDDRGWVPEGCTQRGWSGADHAKGGATEQSLKKAVESLGSQVRSIVVQSGLLKRLQDAQEKRCQALLEAGSEDAAPRREDALALSAALQDPQAGLRPVLRASLTTLRVSVKLKDHMYASTYATSVLHYVAATHKRSCGVDVRLHRPAEPALHTCDAAATTGQGRHAQPPQQADAAPSPTSASAELEALQLVLGDEALAEDALGQITEEQFARACRAQGFDASRLKRGSDVYTSDCVDPSEQDESTRHVQCSFLDLANAAFLFGGLDEVCSLAERISWVSLMLLPPASLFLNRGLDTAPSCASDTWSPCAKVIAAVILQAMGLGHPHQGGADSVVKCAVACQLGMLDAWTCSLQPIGTALQQRNREDLALQAREHGDDAPGVVANALWLRCVSSQICT